MSMPKLILEDYCDDCGHFEPETDRDFADYMPVNNMVFCSNRDHCAHVARHFKNKEKTKHIDNMLDKAGC